MNSVCITGPGVHVNRALKYPDLFKYCPQLLPLQFLGIIGMEEKYEGTLENLNRAFSEEPFVFGFSKVCNSLLLQVLHKEVEFYVFLQKILIYKRICTVKKI